MTIRERIIQAEIMTTTARKEELEKISAPAIMIESLEKELEKLNKGILKCGGATELLDEEYRENKVKQGRGGKTYIQFNGSINYFPRAKYGRYIAKGEK